MTNVEENPNERMTKKLTVIPTEAEQFFGKLKSNSAGSFDCASLRSG
jgi:hypothetical protein